MTENNLTAAKGTVVSFHYRLRDVSQAESETELEDSYAGHPVTYLHGYRNIIPGLETALAGHRQGDEITITLPPEQAYGVRRDNAITRVPIKHLHRRDKRPIKVGEYLALQTEKGIKNVVAVKVGKFNVDVDTNHPLAGRTLNYQLTITEVRQATADELDHGHAHGVGGHQH